MNFLRCKSQSHKQGRRAKRSGSFACSAGSPARGGDALTRQPCLTGSKLGRRRREVDVLRASQSVHRQASTNVLGGLTLTMSLQAPLTICRYVQDRLSPPLEAGKLRRCRPAGLVNSRCLLRGSPPAQKSTFAASSDSLLLKIKCIPRRNVLDRPGCCLRQLIVASQRPGKQIGVGRPTISQLDRLGVSLLVRSSRGLSPTEALHRRANAAKLAARGARLSGGS